MPTRLKDNRAGIQTLDEAKALFDDIAQSTIKMEREMALAENRIAKIKAEATAKIAEIDPDFSAKEEALSDFIFSHPELFQKPRKVKTHFGTFGLHSAKKLQLTDKKAALDFVVDQGMENCFETVYKPVAKGIEAALEAGTKIPGARILDGEVANYTVRKALLDEAKEIK